MRVCIHGALGRMGQRLLALAYADPDLAVTAAVEFERHPLHGKLIGPAVGVPGLDVDLTSDVGAALTQADVAITFAVPDASAACVDAAAAAGVPCIVGTTGFTADHEARLNAAAERIALVHAPNFSVGITVLAKIAEDVAGRIGADFDIEVVETHHNQKVDAPSGTALRLAEGLARGADLDLEQAGVFGRHGQVGKRRRGEIGVMSLRGGDVVGDHTVIFAGTGERLELTHRAQSRDLFATGALRAAKWAADQPAGRYDMFDVLQLR